MAIYKGNTIIAGAEDSAKNVKTDTDQTVGGNKLFTSAIRQQSVGFTKGNTPANNTYWGFYADDNKDLSSTWQSKRLGCFETSVTTGDITQTAIIAYKNEADSSDNSRIAVCYDKANNRAYTAAPTPATNSNTNEIATTAWVKSVAGNAVVAYQHPTAANGYTWYRKWADGWVEQGGIVTNSGNSVFSTITLPIAMSDTNYSVYATQKSDNANMPMCTVVGYYIVSKTQIKIGNRGFNGEYARTQSWEVKGMAA